MQNETSLINMIRTVHYQFQSSSPTAGFDSYDSILEFDGFMNNINDNISDVDLSNSSDNLPVTF